MKDNISFVEYYGIIKRDMLVPRFDHRVLFHSFTQSCQNQVLTLGSFRQFITSIRLTYIQMSNLTFMLDHTYIVTCETHHKYNQHVKYIHNIPPQTIIQ